MPVTQHLSVLLPVVRVLWIINAVRAIRFGVKIPTLVVVCRVVTRLESRGTIAVRREQIRISVDRVGVLAVHHFPLPHPCQVDLAVMGRAIHRVKTAIVVRLIAARAR